MFKQKTISGGIFFVVLLFIGAIVWLNYVSQVELRKAAMSQIQGKTSMEATTLSHFFSDRCNDLEDLSTSREIAAYFENRDLGMSQEYGLWASLINISELFERYVNKKKLDNTPIYNRIGIWDNKGNFLADNTGDESPQKPLPQSIKTHILEDVGTPRIIAYDLIENVMALSYRQNGQFEGTLLVWINRSELLPRLVQCSLLSADRDCTYLRTDNMILSPPSRLPKGLEEDMKNGILQAAPPITEREYAYEGAPAKNYLVIQTTVGGTPFKLLKLTPLREVLGPIAPWQLLLSMVVLATLVLGGAFVALKTGAKNLVLNARVAEAESQAKIIEEKNILLEKEAIARHAAQIELETLNKNLGHMVKERTAELEKQAQTLSQEVNERKEAETALRTIFDNTNDAIFIHEPDGTILDVNDRMLDLYGMDKDTALSMSIAKDLSATENPEAILQDIWAKVMAGDKASFEWKAKRMNGSVFDVKVVLQQIELGGRPIILANVQDISEQKQAMAQQEEYQEFLNTIFKGIGAAIFVFDPVAGVMVDCNQVSEELISLPREEILSNSCRQELVLQTKDKKDLLCPQWRDQGAYDEGVLHLSKEKHIPVSTQTFEVHIGGKSHLVQVVFDITERKNLERQLSMAQKLESIGLLAAGVAHEINTPIQYVGDSITFIKGSIKGITQVMGSYELAVEELPATERQRFQKTNELKDKLDIDFITEEISGACDMALEGVQRVATIVIAMKNFSHHGEEEMKAVNINNAIEDTITVARNEWKYAAEVVTELDPELPLVHCIPGGINQVLLNMVVNAAHAIADKVQEGEKGVITITTQQIEDNVEIRIQDTGCGISQENLRKVFDPFFTTKDVGKGTGQGLAIAHDIVVDKHKGSIAIESEVDVGTTFILKLPIEGEA